MDHAIDFDRLSSDIGLPINFGLEDVGAELPVAVAAVFCTAQQISLPDLNATCPSNFWPSPEVGYLESTSAFNEQYPDLTVPFPTTERLWPKVVQPNNNVVQYTEHQSGSFNAMNPCGVSDGYTTISSLASREIGSSSTSCPIIVQSNQIELPASSPVDVLKYFWPKCTFTITKGHLTQHIITAHLVTLKCQQCEAITNTFEKLDYHASATGHCPFHCPYEACESVFARFDVFRRHVLKHCDDVLRHPCKYCKKYRGADGFKRKDHLTQHLRNYHHIGEAHSTQIYQQKSCPYKDCEAYREGAYHLGGSLFNRWFNNHSFQKQSDYTAHMRKVHNESPFPCPITGCDKINAKGYFRERDFIKHQQKKHGMGIEEIGEDSRDVSL